MALSADKRAELLYQEWQDRHQNFWRLFNIWGSVILLILSSPFLLKRFDVIDAKVLVVPVCALVLSMFGGWNLFCEHDRLCAARTRYDRFMQFQATEHRWADMNFGQRLLWPSYGNHLCLGFLVVLSFSSVGLALYIWAELLPETNGWRTLLYMASVLLPAASMVILTIMRLKSVDRSKLTIRY